MLKPFDEQYRVKVNKMKIERKEKIPYTENINTHLVFGWCVQRTFAYKDASDSLKKYRGKNCVEKFIEHIKNDVKQFYATFSQQSTAKVTHVSKREHEATEN